MKLLLLTPQAPVPADQGARLRNLQLVRMAAEAGHEVHLLAFAPADSERSAEVEVELGRCCRRIETVPPPRPRPLPLRAAETIFSARPDLARRLWSPSFWLALRRRLAAERYDAVQIEGLELTYCLPLLNGVRAIVDDHNAEYVLQRRAFQTDFGQPDRVHAALYSFIQWQKLRRWEARVCRRADAVLAVSRRDAGALEQLSGRGVDIVPNGIDLAAWSYREPAEAAPPELLFDGTMSFRPNDDAARWFCQEILPLVRRAVPEARCWVVGRDPSPELVAFNFARNGVAVTGGVPTVEPYWERAALYVLPIRMGGGVRFKALAAMARGLPLVSTALGMEGTGGRPEVDYLRAERPAEFAAAIVRLLGDIGLRRDLALSARQTVAALDWSRIAPRLLAVYERLAAGPSPRGGGSGNSS